jgi:hypothetical protein
MHIAVHIPTLTISLTALCCITFQVLRNVNYVAELIATMQFDFIKARSLVECSAEARSIGRTADKNNDEVSQKSQEKHFVCKFEQCAKHVHTYAHAYVSYIFYAWCMHMFRAAPCAASLANRDGFEIFAVIFADDCRTGVACSSSGFGAPGPDAYCGGRPPAHHIAYGRPFGTVAKD